jgi:Na+-transporting methylmalonyl-CoA/oxaloacetate decarboxylase gamma subunit
MTLMTVFAAVEHPITQGITIAIAGMLIVGVALSLISLFIAGLPRVLDTIGKFWPEVDEPHGKKSHTHSLITDNDAVIAAIGYVLHCEYQKQLQSDSSAASKN